MSVPAAIRIREAYAGSGVDPALLEQATAELINIFDATTFPEYQIDWTTYPDHIGHLYTEGCFRCHSGEHETESGLAISTECSNCHLFVSQMHEDAVWGEVVYETGPWQHPDGIEDMHEGFACTDCHEPEEPEPTEPSSEGE